jgi:S1-C subfamily serine protease
MFLRIALALVVIAAPVVAQTREPETRSVQAPSQTEVKSHPWLVTILYELSVKDWIKDLQAQGLTVSTVEGIAQSQLITNVASGLVMTPSGQILSRLANFRVRPKPDRLTVITSDGLRFQPQSVEYDSATGYSLLEVPDLKIEPPPFAALDVPTQIGENLRLLFQVPDSVHVGLLPDQSDLAQPRVLRRKELYKIRQIERGAGPSIAVRVVEDTARIAPQGGEGKKGEVVVPGKLSQAQLELKQVDAPDGSVVLNKQGEVVGLMESLGSANCMIKSIEELRHLAERLEGRNQVRRGWIGVRLAPVSGEETKARFGERSTGQSAIVVREVLPDSPAAQADLKPEDLIRRFNGQEVATIRDLSQALARTPIGSEVQLEILRGAELKQVRVRIEPRPRLVSEMARRNLNALPSNPRDSKRSGNELATKNESATNRSSRGVDRMARLGIKVEPLTQSLREYFGISGQGGVLITEVNTASLAGQAGLRAGDAIVGVNGKRVVTQRQLEMLIGRASHLGKTLLSVSRHRKPLQITLDLSKPF